MLKRWNERAREEGAPRGKVGWLRDGVRRVLSSGTQRVGSFEVPGARVHFRVDERGHWFAVLGSFVRIEKELRDHALHFGWMRIAEEEGPLPDTASGWAFGRESCGWHLYGRLR